MVPTEHVVHQAFMNQRVGDRLGALVGRRLLPADVPVEYRIYPPGSCMDWHQDVALYTEPQYEAGGSLITGSLSTLSLLLLLHLLHLLLLLFLLFLLLLLLGAL
jgi:hypothetical protein